MGWHSLLILGGILPLILALLLMLWLPESARFHVVRNRGAERVRKVLEPIAPKAMAGITDFTMPEQKKLRSRNIQKEIFSA
ncbi:aromatic acid/H+ symport family MFS transporter, partial [Pseudomonas syringae pv. tagetis]